MSDELLTPAPPATPDSAAAASRRDLPLGLSGVGFVVLLVLVIAVPHAGIDNSYDDPPASSVITHFFRVHRALEEGQALLHSVAGVLLLVFGLALAARVRRVAGGHDLAARLVTGGATGASVVMVTTMALVSGTVSLTGGVDGRTQWWLYNLGWQEHPRMLFFVPLLLVPACVVLGRAGHLPRPLCWTGQLVAVLAAVAMVGVLGKGTEMLEFPAFLLLMVWVLAAGIVALTRGVGPRPGSTKESA